MESVYLNVLKDAATAVGESSTQAEALSNAVEIVAERLGFDVCSIYLYDPDRERLHLAASRGLRPESIGRVEMGLDEGMSGEVAQTRRPLYTTDAAAHPRFKYFPETGEEQLQTFGGVPLIRGGALVGVLTVQSMSAREFHPNEIVMLETLASLVVSVIQVSRVVRTERGARPREVQCLSGLGTSAGIAHARAIVVGDVRELPLPAEVFRGERAERAALAQAIDSSMAEADEVIASLQTDGVSAEATNIISAHKAILMDPTLIDAAHHAIGGGASAAEAVDAALQPLIERLSQLPAMAEKSHDLADIRAQLLRHLGVPLDEGIPESDEPVVAMASMLSPAQTATLPPNVVAIVTEHGSEMSHMSILARSRGIPAVVGVANLLETVRRGEFVLVDGDNGFVFVAPDGETIRKYERRTGPHADTQRLNSELLSALGEEDDDALQVNLGVGDDELEAAREAGARSCGLLRTEFFFLHQTQWPSAKQQLAYYEPILAAFRGGQVTVRLLDIGGDKQLPYLDHEQEPNPILGYRSLRLLLDNADVYRDQLRSILEAARRHPQTRVRVMVPLVTTVWEMQAARELYEEARAEILPERELPFGMMIEVPAVLYQLRDFLALSDFFSIGTNDLVQYLLAVDRDNERVRNRYVPHHPSVLRALASILEVLAGSPISVCGEMAAQPITALALLALGFEEMSVSPEALTRLRYLRQAVRHAPEDLSVLRADILSAATADAVSYRLRDELRRVAPLLAGI